MIKYPEIDPVALSIPLPEFLHSFLGTALNIHWYGLAYVLGAYLIYLRMCATREKFGINVSKDEVSDVVFTYGLFFGAPKNKPYVKTTSLTSSLETLMPNFSLVAHILK